MSRDGLTLFATTSADHVLVCPAPGSWCLGSDRLMRMKVTMKTASVAALTVCVALCFAMTVSAETKTPFTVTVFVDSRPLPVSPEGFVDGPDKWLQDSKHDLANSLNGRSFHPKKGFPGSTTRYVVVDDPAKADVSLIIATRGTNVVSLGQRTTMEFYRGVVLADTVPSVGVTRWVSMVLSVGTYKKEFVAWSTNQTRWSMGAWSQDARLLALEAVTWVMANEERIRERQRGKFQASQR